MADEDAYGGLFGAFRYALGNSESRLFRSYVVVGGLIAAFVVLVLVAGLINVIAATAGVQGGSLTLSRAFYVVVLVLVLLPLVAPVLLVARRHRRRGGTRGYDAALAAGGYLFVVSVYLALVISAPPARRDPAGGPLAPAIEFLYGLAPTAAFVPPVLAAALIGLAHWRLR